MPPSPVAPNPIRVQSIMCFLSILNQQKKYAGGNIYLSIYTHYPMRVTNHSISAFSIKWKYLLLLKQ